MKTPEHLGGGGGSRQATLLLRVRERIQTKKKTATRRGINGDGKAGRT